MGYDVDSVEWQGHSIKVERFDFHMLLWMKRLVRLVVDDKMLDEQTDWRPLPLYVASWPITVTAQIQEANKKHHLVKAVLGVYMPAKIYVDGKQVS
ncbi:MAG: hypothetical protein A2049_04050 [Elusimicrobia bacterium GWA2_62_23]|nr:MAG: hypothetical protein A2049_04050 [Elusimicrobia bacterium GWA2_62_23]